MPWSVIFECIGWCGAALVVASMLMTSITKLRLINIAGSVLSVASCVAVENWPMAAMNACLIVINVYHLIKNSRQAKAEAEC